MFWNKGLDNLLGSGDRNTEGGLFGKIKESAKKITSEIKEYGSIALNNYFLLNPISRTGYMLEKYSDILGETSKNLYDNGSMSKVEYLKNIMLAKTSKTAGKFGKIMGILIPVIGIAAAGVGYFELHNIVQPNVQDLKIDSDWAFIVYNGNGQGTLYYVGPNGNLHDLGTYNLQMNQDFAEALNVPIQFNQNIVPQHQTYQPLDQIITVYGQNGVILPTHNNTILLNQINVENYTDVVVPQSYLNQFMIALGTGNYKAMYVGANGLQYLEYNDNSLWHLVLETENLTQYAPHSDVFDGESIIETNNNTLIPYGSLGGTNIYGYGYNLPFVIETSGNFYNGS